MSEPRIEPTLLKNLSCDEEFARKVLPYLKEEYFEITAEKEIYNVINEFFQTYSTLPTLEAIFIEVGKKKIAESDFNAIAECLDEFKESTEKPNDEWLLTQTEKFCQDRAIWNALSKSLEIYKGEDKKLDKGAIPSILSDAIGITFDPRVGHDYFPDADERYQFMHEQTAKIPFRSEWMNNITGGGVERKTLNVVMAGVGVGKSLTLCDLSAWYLSLGLDVLYFTMELAEKKVGLRIDANLMDTELDKLKALTHDVYTKKINKVREFVKGELVIKEYPTGGAHVGHFRHAIQELKIKKNFVPKVIMIDYLGICSSSKLKRGSGAADTSYYFQSVSEEFRGLAFETDAPIWTAVQLNREGFDSSEPGMSMVGQSWGIPATSDFFFGLVTSDTLKQLNQLMVIQMKNRYSDESINKKFCIGVDKSRMKLYDVEQSAQDGLDGAEQEPTDREEKLAISKKHGSEAYKSAYNVRRFGKKPTKSKFEGIKVDDTTD